MNRSLLGLLLATSATLAACAPDDVLAPDGSRPASVVLTASTAAPLASLGDSAILSSRVLDRDGRPMDGVQLRWSLSRTGVVERDAEGVYRAVGNGTVTIVAEIERGESGARPAGYWVGRVADSVTIEVRQQPARLALAQADTLFRTLGASRQLRVQVTDARGHPMLDAPPALVWTSADSQVVEVDSAGVVHSLGEGAARITVRAAELSGAATFTVNPHMPHTSCMIVTQRRQTTRSCVTLDFVLRERGVVR